jgi:hypothetical protein
MWQWPHSASAAGAARSPACSGAGGSGSLRAALDTISVAAITVNATPAALTAHLRFHVSTRFSQKAAFRRVARLNPTATINLQGPIVGHKREMIAATRDLFGFPRRRFRSSGSRRIVGPRHRRCTQDSRPPSFRIDQRENLTLAKGNRDREGQFGAASEGRKALPSQPARAFELHALGCWGSCSSAAVRVRIGWIRNCGHETERQTMRSGTVASFL